MFKKLRNKIIIITMAITTVVLVAAGCSVMFFSSAIRPEPMPFKNQAIVETDSDNQELRIYIKKDRNEGTTRLLVTLLSVGFAIEIIVFLITYYLSDKIVAPVQDAYDKQKMFIANASHELKTPLAVIEANMEALEVDEQNETWKNNIENEITHANKLVLDLLKLAKMDAGTIDKNPAEPLDLSTIINERIEIFKPKFSGKIIFKNNNSKTEYSLPKQDLLQVLDILLDNATKYGDQKITISLEENRLIISNDGTTIKKEHLEKIFDRFYQTDKTKAGSGLGLAIAKAICEQNRWQISCESNTKTTKFILCF